MINAFSKSRLIAWGGGAVLAAGGAVLAWLLLAGRLDGSARLSAAALVGFLAANAAVYIARLYATLEYNTLLLYHYEDLNPQKFLAAVTPLLERRLSPSSRCTLMVHIANGQLYAGQPREALETLSRVVTPEKALELRGQVAGNRAACHMALGDLESAQGDIETLRQVAGEKGCKPKLSLKLRRSLAYLQYCMDARRGKCADITVLERDFEACRAPLHKLDVAFHLALLGQKRHDEVGFSKYRDYVAEQGARTGLSNLLKA